MVTERFRPSETFDNHWELIRMLKNTSKHSRMSGNASEMYIILQNLLEHFRMLSTPRNNWEHLWIYSTLSEQLEYNENVSKSFRTRQIT